MSEQTRVVAAGAGLTAERARALLLARGGDERILRLVRLAGLATRAPAVGLVCADGDRLRAAAAINVPAALLDGSAKLCESIERHVLGDGAALVIDDARKHALTRKTNASGLTGAAWAGVPVPFSTGPIAVLAVTDARARSWTDQDVAVLQELAIAVSEQLYCMAGPPAQTAIDDPYRRIFESARDGYCVMNADGCVVEANPALIALIGYPQEELHDLTLYDLIGEAEEREAVRRDVLAGGAIADHEVRLRRKDGTAVDCMIAISRHSNAAGEALGYLATIHDITERKRTQQQLVYNAFHDVLTGLPNRLLFLDRLERVLRHAKRRSGYRFALLFLDLDRFKQVNDTLGHLAGDELLAGVARRLERCLRQEDSVARLGGDEFAMILDSINDVSDATRVAERILHEMEAPFRVQGKEAHVSASIGVALSMSNYDHADHVLRDADAAMYRAKNSGRSRYEVFDTEMHQRAQTQLQLEADLRHAIHRREFAVHYQPVIALDGGNVTGLEALVRWTHPQRGTLLPGDFIAVAEQTGMIVEIGWYVLREACRQLHDWQQRFPRTTFRITMSVNISARQFVQPDLIARIDSILAETGLEPHCLRLELTEAAVMSDTDAARELLGRLRDRGIQICIDDFGTGYSSLQKLKQLPISNFKVDRAFVRDLHADVDSKGIVQTIIALGQSLSVDAIAEGVETTEQLEELRALGLKFAQGFLFASPLEALHAEELLVG